MRLNGGLCNLKSHLARGRSSAAPMRNTPLQLHPSGTPPSTDCDALSKQTRISRKVAKKQSENSQETVEDRWNFDKQPHVTRSSHLSPHHRLLRWARRRCCNKTPGHAPSPCQIVQNRSADKNEFRKPVSGMQRYRSLCHATEWTGNCQR